MAVRFPRRRGLSGPAKRAIRRRRDGRLSLENLELRRLLTGTWTEVTNPLPNGDTAQTMLVLSNGDILVNGGNAGAETGDNDAAKAWYELTPDSTGSYANGTWTTLAPSNQGRLFYSSDVLSNGSVYVGGGEYSTTGGDGVTGEVYNPNTNTWTTTPDFPASNQGDAISETLPGGDVLVGSFASQTAFLYNPTTNTWSDGPNDINGDSYSEEGWVKLADGSTLDYQLQAPTVGETVRLIPGATPQQDTWVEAATCPVALGSNGGNDGLVDELGPAELMPNGQVFWIGASDNTAIYTPPTQADPLGSWTTGPTQQDPSGNPIGGFDAPSAMETDGDVLWAASGINGDTYPGPTTIQEYDPTTDKITIVPGPAARQPVRPGLHHPDGRRAERPGAVHRRPGLEPLALQPLRHRQFLVGPDRQRRDQQ